VEEKFIAEILLRLAASVLAGGAIGLERSINGRPAGFRTHTLVCMASAVLMALAVFQRDLLPFSLAGTNVDPMRLAQGIMTGIGFLGAGVIVKEKLGVRGLTTAASIWITSSIGIVFGAGLYRTGAAATLLTMGVLAFFRKVEDRVPSRHYASLNIGFLRERALTEEALAGIINAHRVTINQPNYHLVEKGNVIRYQMTVHTRAIGNFSALTTTLGRTPEVHEFSLQHSGN
jgi:putative Mg2+ transporter-C (MgtC) family protein